MWKKYFSSLVYRLTPMAFLRYQTLLFLISFLLLGNGFLVAAADIQATAQLSRHRAAAGEMLQLDVKVTGAQEADVPHEISVEGLQIKLVGQSSQVQMVNFSVSSLALYSYIIIPLRSGSFTIPAIQVRADGKTVRTAPQQLTIEGTTSSSTAVSPNPPIANTPRVAPAPLPPSRSSSSANTQIAFSELLIPKKRLYVGEVVPAEIRFYVDGRYNATPRHGVDFSNEGLLVERLSDPESSTEERHGILYNTVTFHTFISAVKPGTLSVGPATLDLVVDLPIANSMGMPDVVSQLLGRSGGMSQQRSVTVKSNKVSLEVVPLPSEGCPDSFAGAIGDFQIDAMALPKKYSVGDPINLAITIEGEGNFKAISRPQLTDTNGWKIYPPTDRIDAPDTAGLHGIKTFETTMMTQEPKTTTPGSIFSYFNPNTGKYVTLTTKPLPLQVIPSAAATPTPPADTASSSPALATSAPKAQHHMLEHYSMRSWQPLCARREYLLATGALFCALLLFVGYLAFNWYQTTESLVYQQQLKKLWQELEDDQLDADLFFNKAALYAELLMKKDPSLFPYLEDIFKRRDEVNYGARETILRPQDRLKVLDTLATAPQTKNKP